MERQGNGLKPPYGMSGLSLRTKLLLFAAALVLVPGAIYGAIALSSSRDALAQVVGRELVEAARGAADRLAASLRSERERLESYAAQDVMREIRIADFDKRISSFLVSVKRGCPACVGLLVVDTHGRVVAASNPAWIGTEAHALAGAQGDANPVIEGPLPAALPSTEWLRLSVPVPDPDATGAVLGRLVVLLDWLRATAIVTRVRENLLSVDLNADVLIADRSGRVLRAAAGADGAWQAGDLLALAPQSLRRAAEAGFVDEDAGMLLGYAPLPDDLPGWGIVVAEPSSIAFAPVRRAARLLAAVLGGTLLIAVALAVLAARRVTRPLAELTQGAQAVGRGARPLAAVAVRSGDEVGALADAFNRMAADLARAEHEVVEAAKFSFVGELAAGVAHEIRTPLGVLRSSAQLLACSSTLKDEDSQDLLRLLRDEVDRIDRVVSALLDLGRPRQMRPEASPLGDVLARAASFVDAQARAKHVALRRGTMTPDPVIRCDPELIYQVVLNLLVNAVQILPEGGAIDVGLIDGQDGYVGFEVRDNGPGMSAELRDRVFEPFFTRREGGTGLGLTFVQRVVQEHRGRVEVDSAPGRGTAFRVWLPL